MNSRFLAPSPWVRNLSGPRLPSRKGNSSSALPKTSVALVRADGDVLHDLNAPVLLQRGRGGAASETEAEAEPRAVEPVWRQVTDGRRGIALRLRMQGSEGGTRA